MREPLRIRPFALFWGAETAGAFGLAITTVAVDVLVVDVLQAAETEVGLVRAVQFLPYLLIGLLAGALVDRWRRRPTLVAAGLGRGLLLLTIPVLWLTGHLSLWTVAAVLFVAGVMGVFAAAAAQSFVPSLVPRALLVPANARTGQSGTVAQTSGPVLGGGLVSWIGAPLTLLVDAAAHLLNAVIISRVDVDEPQRSRTAALPPVRRDIADGVRFIYRHRTLGPLAISTHVWFLGNSAAMTVFAVLALRGLGLAPYLYGLVLALAGVGGLAGALLAPRVGRRLGEGTTMLVGRTITPVAWGAVALVPDRGAWTVGLLAVALAAYGFGLGLEDPNELGYRQAVTPPGMLGRVNATMRSANRTMAVVGSLLGGVLAGAIGYRAVLWSAVGVFAVAVVVIGASPLRGARSE